MCYRTHIFPALLFLTVLLAVSCDTTQPTGNDQNDHGGSSFSHTQGPGSSAVAFLRDDDYTELMVEIQYMPGYEPTEAAVDSLRAFLEKHLHKTEIIIPAPVEIPSGGQEEYSANDVRQLEEEHRQHYTEDSMLASYNLFVDGSYASGNVLGIAYFNTSNGYFGETIHEVSGSPPLSPPRSKIEAIVFNHEYGHLIGLVDNGVAMQEEHQEQGSHCTEDSCIMYHTVNTADFFGNLFDGDIPDLDEYCLQDIHAVQEADDPPESVRTVASKPH